MSTSALPGNYEQWKHCITVDCGIELTPEFINARLDALNNKKDHHTKKFTQLYGEEHLRSVIGWFEQAKSSFN